MVEPVSLTFGTFAAGLLVKAAESAVGEAAKDAYKAFRDWVKGKAGDELALLEKKPQSGPLREALADTINALPAADQDTLRDLAKAMIDQLSDAAGRGPVGLDVGWLEDARIDLGRVHVTQGKGVHVDTARGPGAHIKIDELTVGPQPGKAKR